MTQKPPVQKAAAVPQTAATAQTHELAMYKQTVIDRVAAKVNQYIDSGEINLPAKYSPHNAMKQAWLILQSTTNKDNKPALEVCTRDSVANSMLDMIIQGLNPQKKQVYFIVYGNKLVCQRSYFGAMAVAKMVNPNIPEDGFSYEIKYEGDTLEYEIVRGKRRVVTHKQKFENIDKAKIEGAYCEVYDKEGALLHSEIMTIEEIHQSWKQSPVRPFDDHGKIKPGSTHGKFPRDMALRTAINKVCKIIINASSDNALLLEQINRSEDLTDRAVAETEIDENANTGAVMEIEVESSPEPESETEIPEASNAGLIHDLCITTRKCQKFQEPADQCPNASNKILIEKCVQFKNKGGPDKKTTSGTVPCPDQNGKVVARLKCEACPKREGCPEHEAPPPGQQTKAPGF